MRDYLLSKGIGDERMTVVNYGEMNPIADNATEEGARAEPPRSDAAPGLRRTEVTGVSVVSARASARSGSRSHADPAARPQSLPR